MATCIDFGLGRVRSAGIDHRSADEWIFLQTLACVWARETRPNLARAKRCRRYAAGQARTTQTICARCENLNR
jgi:hypothetical protein